MCEIYIYYMLKMFEEYNIEDINSSIDPSVLTVEDGMLKVWHYSNTDITDGYISPGKSQNRHSGNEYKTWGKSRAFFYGTPGGYKDDSIGMSHDYTYTCLIPLIEIYDKGSNPDGFEPTGNDSYYNELYEFTKERGYTAWMYNLGGKSDNPIIISFIDVEISEAYRKSKGGFQVKKDEALKDYKIGEVTLKGFGERKLKTWDVMQPGESLKSMSNVYLKRGRDVNRHFGGSTYLHSKVKLLPEFEGQY